MRAVRHRSPREVVPLDRPLVALADRDPGDLDLLPGLEDVDGDGLADDELGRPSQLGEPAVRLDAVLAEMADLGLRQLPLRDRVVGDLDRLVAVRLRRPDRDDGTRPRLDDGHGRDGPGLRIEDPRHAQLPADDPLHFRLRRK